MDYPALRDDGFLVLPDLVDSAHLARFEQEIDTLARGECRRLGLTPTGDAEPFVSLVRYDGRYWPLLYKLLEEMFVLNRIAVDIGRFLEDSGFLRHEGFEVPLIWPDIRADPPNDSTLLLPVHQDFASTRCHRAWRLWVPLRDADEQHGTMRVYAGTHRHGILAHDFEDPRYPTVTSEHWQDAPSHVMTLPAGHAVLFHPLLLHESVPNRSNRMKFTMLVQAQDLATVCHPDDPADPLSRFLEWTSTHATARKSDLSPSSPPEASSPTVQR